MVIFTCFVVVGAADVLLSAVVVGEAVVSLAAMVVLILLMVVPIVFLLIIVVLSGVNVSLVVSSTWIQPHCGQVHPETPLLSLQSENSPHASFHSGPFCPSSVQ